MGVFLQQLANALCVGSLYALPAIGYTMVYGVLRLINFAHGEIFMMAMYIVFYGIGLFLLPWYIGFTATILITALLGVLSERLAYRPLRDAPRISVLISATGVSYFLQKGQRPHLPEHPPLLRAERGGQRGRGPAPAPQERLGGGDAAHAPLPAGGRGHRPAHGRAAGLHGPAGRA